MRSVVMVTCTGAICYALRGWWLPMWLFLILAAVVAGCDLFRESEK